MSPDKQRIILRLAEPSDESSVIFCNKMAQWLLLLLLVLPEHSFHVTLSKQ